MKKKFLLVLPLITLVAGCGVKKTNIYELPKGGRDVNIEDEEDLTNFRDLINEALIKSADALLSKAKVNLMIEHLSGHFLRQYVDKDNRDKTTTEGYWNEFVNKDSTYDGNEKIEVDVDDLCLDLGVNAWGLGGNVEDISAQVDLSASGGVNFEMIDFRQDRKDESPVHDDHFTAEASCEGGKLTAWLQGGDILLDARDKAILEFIAPIAGTIEDPSNPNSFNGLVNLLAGRWCISGLIPEEVLENPITDGIEQLSTMLEEVDPGSFFCALLNPELFPDVGSAEFADMFTDVFTCRVYDDNSIGVQGTITGEWANEAFGFERYEEIEDYRREIDDMGVTDESWATVTILFNKDLYLSSIGIQVSANFFDKYVYARFEDGENCRFNTMNIDVLAEGSIGLTFDFNPKEVKLPNLDNFQPLDISSLLF